MPEDSSCLLAASWEAQNSFIFASWPCGSPMLQEMLFVFVELDSCAELWAKLTLMSECPK